MTDFFIQNPNNNNTFIINQTDQTNKFKKVEVTTNDAILFPDRRNETDMILEGQEPDPIAKIDSIFLSDEQYNKALNDNVMYFYRISGINTKLTIKNDKIVYSPQITENRYKILTVDGNDLDFSMTTYLTYLFYFDPTAGDDQTGRGRWIGGGPGGGAP